MITMTKIFATTMATASLSLSLVAAVDPTLIADNLKGPLKVGDEICVEGYVVDTYCINRGTFIDKPDVWALQHPDEHTFHCLIDVPACIGSPFNVLLNPTESLTGTNYRRGFVLDEISQNNAITLAKQIGSCESCDHGTDDENYLVEGFRVVMKAVVADLNEGDKNQPPLINVAEMQSTSTYYNDTSDVEHSACVHYYNMYDIATMNEEANNSILGGIIIDVKEGEYGRYAKFYIAHGALMLMGWGLLLPSGVVIAKFFKHRPDGLWFKIHRLMQSTGLLFALAAWVIALTQFSVFGFKDIPPLNRNYQHGVLGMTTMILGLLQPINAVLRPHAPENGLEKSTGRKLWEYLHKGSGYLAIALTIPTIVFGTLILPVPDLIPKYQIAYGAGCWGSILCLMSFIFIDKLSYNKKNNMEKTTAKGDDVEEQAATATPVATAAREETAKTDAPAATPLQNAQNPSLMSLE